MKTPDRFLPISVMNQPAFPFVVRVGQTRATIYPTPSRDCTAFTVCWYEGPLRKRKAFSDLDAAKLHANAPVNSLSRGEAGIVRLSGAERPEYLRAREAVSEFRISLDTAAIEYRDVRRLLDGLSLLEAARHYARQKRVDLPIRSHLVSVPARYENQIADGQPQERIVGEQC